MASHKQSHRSELLTFVSYNKIVDMCSNTYHTNYNAVCTIIMWILIQ